MAFLKIVIYCCCDTIRPSRSELHIIKYTIDARTIAGYFVVIGVRVHCEYTKNGWIGANFINSACTHHDKPPEFFLSRSELELARFSLEIQISAMARICFSPLRHNFHYTSSMYVVIIHGFGYSCFPSLLISSYWALIEGLFDGHSVNRIRSMSCPCIRANFF